VRLWEGERGLPRKRPRWSDAVRYSSVPRVTAAGASRPRAAYARYPATDQEDRRELERQPVRQHGVRRFDDGIERQVLMRRHSAGSSPLTFGRWLVTMGNPLAKRPGRAPDPLVYKGKVCAGEGSRTPMSFRTDGFEPSAYTIPPPRPES